MNDKNWANHSLMQAIGQDVKVSGYTKVEEGVVLLDLSDGRKLELSLDADCCSNSYFTDVTQFAELAGRTILEAEERDGDGFEEKNSGNSIRPHFLVFKTDGGHVTIDWRNASNGYYDGTLLWEVKS